MIVGLLGLAPIVPVDHDESQYLAAAALTRSGLPFVDFLHLQTPLQSFVTAPIAALSGGYSYLVLRITTAIAALATLWFVFRCQRRLGVGDRTAICATALLSLTYSFQFGATLVRNDMMPAVLLTIGLCAAIVAIEGRRSALLWAIAGLAFSAAVGTKLSYAVPAAAVGLFHLLTVGQRRSRQSLIDASACAAGALAGLVPVAFLYARAPMRRSNGIGRPGRAIASGSTGSCSTRRWSCCSAPRAWPLRLSRRRCSIAASGAGRTCCSTCWLWRG